jgi:hypothetical protein
MALEVTNTQQVPLTAALQAGARQPPSNEIIILRPARLRKLAPHTKFPLLPKKQKSDILYSVAIARNTPGVDADGRGVAASFGRGALALAKGEGSGEIAFWALWHLPEDPVMGSFSSWFYSFQRHLFTVARIGRTFIKDNKEVLLC